MHPAFSVILFTTASGAGYGMLILFGGLSLADDLDAGLLLYILFPALALATLGLLSSTLHLGHPERAWRAFSQWRSSWLAREGVVAVTVYIPPVIGLVAALFFNGRSASVWQAAAPLTALLALITVICTGMIYASLKPIPRWHNGWVVPVYTAFSLATGAAWLAPMMSLAGSSWFAWTCWVCCGASIFAWALKLGYWRHIDGARAGTSVARALGMEHLGRVRQIEGPHTGSNFVMREMGYQIARKHARRLRLIAAALGGVAAPVLAAAAALSVADETFAGMLPALILSCITIAAASLAVLIERWLFFAEAEHMSMLYYGAGPGGGSN